MCNKKKKGCGCRKCHKKKAEKDFKRAWKKIAAFKPAKGFKPCLRCSKAHMGKYMKGNKTKKVPYIRVKTIGKRRKGGMWLDDDYYLANMPVGDMPSKQKGKYAFLK